VRTFGQKGPIVSFSFGMAAVAAIERYKRGTTDLKESAGKPDVLFGQSDEENIISFHLAEMLGHDFKLPVGLNSVQYLRQSIQHTESQHETMNQTEGEELLIQKNKRSELLKKQNSLTNLAHQASNLAHQAFGNMFHNTGVTMEVWVHKLKVKTETDMLAAEWQERLLIVSRKRLFIVMKKNRKDSTLDNVEEFSLDIVDSIPLNEVDRVNIVDSNDSESEASRSNHCSAIGMIYSCIAFIEKLSMTIPDQGQSILRNRDTGSKLQERSEKLLHQDEDTAAQIAQGKILRITTVAGGFNNGQPYYFSNLCNLHCKNSNPQHSQQQDAIQAFVREMNDLTKTYKELHAVETRFERLQANLKSIWGSFYCNILILVIIVSNFVFTIRGMEVSSDTSDYKFYERVDLAYTILFTIGSVLQLFCCADAIVQLYKSLVCAELAFNFAAHAVRPFFRGKRAHPFIICMRVELTPRLTAFITP
jgi:hypothetical protein